jgi:protein-disulfide isomerase
MQKMKNVAFIIALLLMPCLMACQQKETSQTGVQVQEEVPAPGHVLNGSAASPVKIEVFSDLQCPSCRELFLKTLKQVMKEYENRVSITYYEFPLSMHQYARRAARYVAAAAKLGQPQALSAYEAVFNDQEYWSVDGNLEGSVSKALSSEDFQRVRQLLRDANSLAEIDAAIEKEQQLGMLRGVNSTPTMFISHDGKEEKIVGSLNYQVMNHFLESVIMK